MCITIVYFPDYDIINFEINFKSYNSYKMEVISENSEKKNE